MVVYLGVDFRKQEWWGREQSPREGQKANKRCVRHLGTVCGHRGLDAGGPMRNQAEHASGSSHGRMGKLGIDATSLILLWVWVAPTWEIVISSHFGGCTWSPNKLKPEKAELRGSLCAGKHQPQLWVNQGGDRDPQCLPHMVLDNFSLF